MINHDCSGWAFIPCRGDDCGLTWLPPSRIHNCFFSRPLDVVLEGPYKFLQGKSHRRRWGLWNTKISYHLPSLQLLLSIFLRTGWIKFGRKFFPISPLTEHSFPQPTSPPPPAYCLLTVTNSICYPTPCSAYVFMYVFNDQERTDCPKIPYWGENKLKSKIKGKYKYPVVFWKLADPVPMLLQVINGSST